MIEREKKMNLEQIKTTIKQPEYDFLRTDPHLGKNIILLGLGGSHAYGMDKETSDLDIRGIALNSKKEILLGKDFEQVVNAETDTTIYSFNKMIELLISNNPNTCEILGLEDWQYLYVHPIGKELIDNRKMFLSKICIQTFGGYANAQLRRLENKAARLTDQSKNELHVYKSICNATHEFRRRYYPYNDGDIKLYIDESDRNDYETEIFMDMDLKHYPLRDWCGLWNEMKAIVTSYKKFGKRNEKAMSHDKLGKHSAHLIRLFMMAIDILEKEEIITYRREEHDLLMSIRNGEWLDDNRQPMPAFYDLVNEYEKRFDYAKKNTSLPDVPDYKRINEFKAYVNERIVRGDI